MQLFVETTVYSAGQNALERDCATFHHAEDLIWQKSPERFQLSLDEEDCGNQDRHNDPDLREI